MQHTRRFGFFNVRKQSQLATAVPIGTDETRDASLLQLRCLCGYLHSLAIFGPAFCLRERGISGICTRVAVLGQSYDQVNVEASAASAASP